MLEEGTSITHLQPAGYRSRLSLLCHFGVPEGLKSGISLHVLSVTLKIFTAGRDEVLQR